MLEPDKPFVCLIYCLINETNKATFSCSSTNPYSCEGNKELRRQIISKIKSQFSLKKNIWRDRGRSVEVKCEWVHTCRYVQSFTVKNGRNATVWLIANLFLQCGNFSVILIVTLQSVGISQGKNRAWERTWFVKSMKLRIRSHSTDNTCRQPSAHTPDHTISHKHYKVHLSKWMVLPNYTSRQTGMEIRKETKSVETNHENRLSPNTPPPHTHTISISTAEPWSFPDTTLVQQY